MIGRTLSHYQVIEKIGEGGMGIVYRAHDPHLDRDVCIKVLPDELSGSIQLERFVREIQIAKNLTHPNILPVYDAGEDGGRLFYVMPLMAGDTLRDRLVREKPLSLSLAVSIGGDVAAALDHAHSHSIIHRDIKPSNILLSGDRAVVADFGLALALETSGDHRITQRGTSVGTPSYMSPEQASGQEFLDARSDLYSLGCVLYEMLCGAPPFTGSSVRSILRRHLTEEPAPLSDRRRDVPEPLCEVVAKLLDKEPNKRPLSAKVVVDELSHAISRAGNETEMRTRTRIVSSSSRPSPRRWGLAFLAIVLMMAGVMGAWWWYGRGPASAPDVRVGSIPSDPVVAVLPFENLTGDPDLDHIGLGTAHALTSSLSALPGVTMISRSAARGFEDVAELSSQMGAGFVVTGSLLAAGERLQVNAQLVRADNSIAWGGSFEGTEARLFDLQRRLSHAIVVALRLDVSPERSRRLDETPTDNREAYAEYSQAQAFLERQDLPGNVERARDLFQGAVTRDPEFALAHAGLAEAYWQLYVESGDVQWTDEAARSAERARELDPEHPSVHYSSAVIDFGMGRYDQGLMELDRALVLKPGHDEALQLKGRILERLGQFDAAADAYRRAIDIRPAFWGHHRRLGLLYLRAGRLQEAEGSFRRITELQPDLSWGHQMLGTAYHMEGEVDEAILHYTRATEMGNSPAALSNLGVIYYRRRDYQRAAGAFRDSLELEEDAVSRRSLGDALRKLGRESEARAEYEKAIALVRKQLEVNPNNAESLSIWGLCEAKLGRDEEAQRRASQAERAAPRNVDVLHRSAVVHAFAGRPQQAIDALRRAISFGLSPSEAAADDDFDSIRESPEFQSLIKPTSR